MKVSYVVLLLVLACAYVQAIPFQFSANVSGVEANGWQYRRTSAEIWFVGTYVGANFFSKSVQNNPATGVPDGIASAVNVSSGVIPVLYSAFFNRSSAALPITSDMAYVTTADMSLASDYIATQFIRIDEITPLGVVAKSQNLRCIIGTSTATTGMICRLSGYNVVGDMQFITLTLTPSVSSTTALTIEFNFVISNVAGVVNQTSASVGPKIIQTVMSILRWSYANVNNSLSLVVGFGTGPVSLQATNRTMNTNSTNPAFFSFGKDVTVNTTAKIYKNVTSISFNASDLTQLDNPVIAQHLQKVYGNSATFTIGRVAFPPGALEIVYDPAQGFGNTMEDAQQVPLPNGASRLSLSLLAFISALLLVVMY